MSRQHGVPACRRLEIYLAQGLRSGAGNALSELLYGTGKLKGAGDAFIRGARTGAVMAGFKNIYDTAGAYGMAGSRLFTQKPNGANIPGVSGTRRDPKGMCGSPDPFELSNGLGNGRGYHSGSRHGMAGDGSGFGLGGFVKDVLTGAVTGGLGSAGFYGAWKDVEALRGSVVGRGNGRQAVPQPNHGQGFSRKGYYPKPGERTFEGYVQQMVPSDAELSLYTTSKEFNSVGNIGGEFKRFGTKSGRHGINGVHVHQPIRNVNLKTGEIRGGVFNPKKGIGVDSPKRLDIKQLYQFLFNGKYH